LDAKLAAAFSRIATGEIASKILLEKERLALKGRLLKGRQIYKMLFNHYRVAEAEGAAFDFRDLLNVRMKGDIIDKFWNEFEMMLMGLKERPSDTILESLIRAQLERCIPCREVYGAYSRLDVEDKT
jgi:hypothetical protein